MQETATVPQQEITKSKKVTQNKSGVLREELDIVEPEIATLGDLEGELAMIIKDDIITDKELTEFKDNLSKKQLEYCRQSFLYYDDVKLKEYLMWLKNGLFEPENAKFRERVDAFLTRSARRKEIAGGFLGLHHITGYVKFHNELEKNK